MAELRTRDEIRRDGIAALRDKLGVDGFIQFMQAFGFSRGNWTEERKELLKGRTVQEIYDEIMKEREDSNP